MTNKTIIILAVLTVGILTTSSAYALSDWRSECSINNPLDNLECAIDHLEAEINNLGASVAILEDIDHNAFSTGAHTIDTDTQLDQTGIESFGFVTGSHTVDTDTIYDDSALDTRITTLENTPTDIYEWDQDDFIITTVGNLSSTTGATKTCPEGQIIISGGGRLSAEALSGGVIVVADHPHGLTQWKFLVTSENIVQDVRISVFTICKTTNP